MKKMTKGLVFLIFLALPGISFSGTLQVYPGAKVEDVVYEANQSVAVPQMQKGPKVIIFTTNDLFENVVAFYRGSAREYRMPGERKPTKLPSGQELKEAYFILDNASDILTSKHWIKIQRPYLIRDRTTKGFQEKYETVRNVTAIIEEDRRTYP